MATDSPYSQTPHVRVQTDRENKMGHPQVTMGFNTEMVIHDLDGLG